MVPVQLRLRNFLSYGETNEPLDFSSFHVACLSGGNGQGKSALLDAITWAIWGEARKSSDQRKPDEEILRIGAREMEVDLTFDLDGARYRIVRSYQQSASGKTSKPGLEVQVLDAESGAMTPLTAETVRATQAVIDAHVGIDYETFINSTFLLQGRSDEFTKKRPTERKQILAKILGLDRYDRLSARAASRWSRLRERANQIEAEIERLSAALEPVGRWEAERETVAATVETTTADLAALDASLAALADQIARFDATAREVTAHREALADLGARRDRALAEASTLGTRIDEASALVEQADEIEAAHARYEALRAERKALDEKAVLHRGVEAQLHALDLDAKNRTADAEADLIKLQARIDAAEAQIRDDERAVAGRPQLLERLDAARDAEKVAAEMDRVHALREAADRKRGLARTEVAREAARLAERKSSLETAIADAQLLEPPSDDALASLDERLAAAQVAAERRAKVSAEGKEVKAALDILGERREELVAQQERLSEQKQRILTADVDDCPTCGTPLTAEHRQTVAADFDEQIAGIGERLAVLDGRIARGREQREALLASYASLDHRAGDLDALRTERAAAEEARKTAQSRAERLAGQRAALREVTAALDADAYAPEHRAALLDAEEVLAAHPYSPETHRSVAALAATRPRLDADRVALDAAEARLDERRSRRTADTAALEERRHALDAGSHLAELNTRREALRSQLAAIGFDAQTHERTSAALEDLADAPARLTRLLEARRSLAEWTERRADLAARIRKVEAEQTTRETALAALAEALSGRDATVAEHAARQAERHDLDRRRTEALARRGGLDARLSAAAEDRVALAEHRRSLRAVKKERALYGHLKRAFGRNGIPSLIIEETLPEVEDRANALLDRLTDGGTRVTLQTLKDKKAGGTKETLDIRITDAQGVARAYETYSGGEAFRVNFALRIALSQMLAERSGRRIRTLVIDEGFGTQDEQGLQNLVGAIRAIQDDFDKVLVITHLDELKAAFPVRIEVSKQPVVGSTYQVLGV